MRILALIGLGFVTLVLWLAMTSEQFVGYPDFNQAQPCPTGQRLSVYDNGSGQAVCVK